MIIFAIEVVFAPERFLRNLFEFWVHVVFGLRVSVESRNFVSFSRQYDGTIN